MQSGQPYDVMIDKLIIEKAYQHWEWRGRPIGSPEVDWYRAVDDLKHEQRQHGLTCSIDEDQDRTKIQEAAFWNPPQADSTEPLPRLKSFASTNQIDAA